MTRPLNVLCACECSGRVRSAFRALGHNAFSADLLPAEDNGPHIICHRDLHLLDIIAQGVPNPYLASSGGLPGPPEFLPWDLLIAFPPCTFLCNSSVHLLTSSRPQEANRPAEMRQAAHFFRALLDSPIPHIAIENPIMHGHALTIIGSRHSQTIQPYNFGHDASKRTCLWLKNLPPLQNSGPFIPPRLVKSPDGVTRKRWANQTDSGQNRLPPSPHRAADRSRTFPGIAQAMAQQWSNFLSISPTI